MPSKTTTTTKKVAKKDNSQNVTNDVPVSSSQPSISSALPVPSIPVVAAVAAIPAVASAASASSVSSASSTSGKVVKSKASKSSKQSGGKKTATDKSKKKATTASGKKTIKKAVAKKIVNKKAVAVKKASVKKVAVSKKEVVKSTEPQRSVIRAEGSDEDNSKTRFFKVIVDGGDAHGRFSGNKPKQAANKALTSILKTTEHADNGEIKFSIVECTRGSKHKKYNYIGKRVKLDNPMKVTIGNGDDAKVIEYKFNNRVMKDKAAIA